MLLTFCRRVFPLDEFYLKVAFPFLKNLFFFNFHYSSVYMYYNFSKWKKQQFRLILIFWLALEYATHFIHLCQGFLKWLRDSWREVFKLPYKIVINFGDNAKKCSFWRRLFPFLMLFTLSILCIILWKSLFWKFYFFCRNKNV